MLTRRDLRTISRARLGDARVLLRQRRHDGAVYPSGYAVELALKARICVTLKWPGFPSTRKEFEGYSSFRTPDLDVLLHLSGREARVKSTLFAEWSSVGRWNPEIRYDPIKTARSDAEEMLRCVELLLRAL